MIIDDHGQLPWFEMIQQWWNYGFTTVNQTIVNYIRLMAQIARPWLTMNKTTDEGT